ncbi:MAG: N-6 DNA methylase [bacterium]|nr:N-6 DNA methylase [bacterium]
MNSDLRKKLSKIIDTLLAGGGINPVTCIEQLSYLIYLKLLDEEESNPELHELMASRKKTTRAETSASGAAAGTAAITAGMAGAAALAVIAFPLAIPLAIAAATGAFGSSHARKLYPNQAERYRWSSWRSKTGTELRDFVRDEVFPYMGSLIREQPQIAEYFRDATLEIADPNVLKQVIDELDSISFLKLGTDITGDIFEYILIHIGQSSLSGKFRTPRQIRTMMVAMVDPDLGDAVCDPACGTAGFLIDTVEHILAKYSEHVTEVPIYGEEWLDARQQTTAQAKNAIPNLQTYRKGAGEKIPSWDLLEHSVYGYDVSRQMMRIATMNLVLHGIRQANVTRANSLSDIDGLSDEDVSRKYKIILSNPPLTGALPSDSIRKDLPTTSKRSELLFLAMMMESLAPGGYCAVVIPEDLLFGSTSAHVQLRKKLLLDFEILAVISLPKGVFKPYTGVKTAVLVFRKPEGKRSVDSVWFYDVRNDGYDPDEISGGGRFETPDQNDIPAMLATWQEYKQRCFTKPPGIEAGTTLASGMDEPRCWWAPVSIIADNEYNLAASRYKPLITAKAPDEDPLELIHETLALEREIAEGLEKLLKNLDAQ